MPKILFDRENENRPFVAANAVIIKTVKNKEHILLGKRKNVADANHYYPPAVI